MQQICSSADVKRYIDTIGRFSSTEISDEITKQTEDVYDEVGDPLAATISGIGRVNSSATEFYLRYYVGEPKIYDIEKVYVGTTTKRELTETTDYEVSSSHGMLKLTSSTVDGKVLNSADDIIIHYIPKIYSRYCAIKTAESLAETLDVTQKGKMSKELQLIEKRLDKVGNLINNKLGVAITSDYENFNQYYGVNLKRITQNFDTNRYMWS